MRKICYLFITFYCSNLVAFDFFILGKVRYISKGSVGRTEAPIVYEEVQVKNNDKKKKIFIPYLQVDGIVREQTMGTKLFAKAYFYDASRKMIDTVEAFPVSRGNKLRSAMPTFFKRNNRESIYFAVPCKVRQSDDWSAVIIFGDDQEVAVASYPNQYTTIRQYKFPELSLYLHPKKNRRTKHENPLIEYVVKTNIKSHPQITFFLRKPIGATTFQDANGVLALCVLSDSVDTMRKRLQEAEIKDDLTPTLRFAEQNKLIIICWGSQRFWNSGLNWDDLNRNAFKEIDNKAKDLADAWERGIRRLSNRYQIPTENYLLCGFSGSAQYALRLAMKKPKYFLAVHLHIPSSFDFPSPQARNIMWCLTTGEWEVGYERSIKFLEAAQKSGYPIIYKAIPRLGHANHQQSTEIGLEFFRYALAIKTENNKKPNGFYQVFQNPPYVADVFRS